MLSIFLTAPRGRIRLACALFCTLFLALPAAQASTPPLPPDIDAALARAKLPRDNIALLVTDVDGQRPPRLAWRSQAPMNPASVMKLLTTYAALDVLGPAFVWHTPVYVEGRVQGGVLDGNLYIEGQGDPKLVLERLWLLLRRIQAQGIHTIRGDIVLDRSAFELRDSDPAAFDGKPLKPYNAAPDALLLNYKSMVLNFTPDGAGQSMQVQMDPPLAGVTLQRTVPTAPGRCEDWRTQLRASFDATHVRFAGSYPTACGEGNWPVAYPDPRNFATRTIAGMWAEMGGQLQGQVREGRVPAALTPAFSIDSPPLAEIVRDINKYSNNVMAEQLFLTLGLQANRRGSVQTARAALRQWWNERIGTAEGQPTIDNGSGLSLASRISPAQLARMLQHAWRSPVMPELAASLPLVGVDGTLRKRVLRSGAGAHLKSGTMPESGVAAVAGFVDGASGRRYVLVAIANHADVSGTRAVFDTLTDWAARDE